MVMRFETCSSTLTHLPQLLFLTKFRMLFPGELLLLMLSLLGVLHLLYVLRLNELHFVILVGEMHSPMLLVGEQPALLGNELPTTSSRSQKLIKLEILFLHQALMLPVLNEISSEMYCYDRFGFYLLARRNRLRQ